MPIRAVAIVFRATIYFGTRKRCRKFRHAISHECRFVTHARSGARQNRALGTIGRIDAIIMAYHASGAHALGYASMMRRDKRCREADAYAIIR